MSQNYLCSKHGLQDAYTCKVADGKTREICKLCVKERRKARYDRDPVASRTQVNAWRAEHREESRVISNKCYEKNKDKYLPKARARRREVRLGCLRAYSPEVRCALCDEQHDQFLCLDHIEGGGVQHRKEVGYGDNFYKWIVKNNYPLGFRVLCHNCNFKENLRRNLEIFENREWQPKTRVIDGKEYRVDREKSALADRRHDLVVKTQCISHYGGEHPQCDCCKNDDFDSLAIDHIYGGGRKQRKELDLHGNQFYQWLVTNQFPDGFRILCHNCNFAVGVYGKCPHTADPPITDVSVIEP